MRGMVMGVKKQQWGNGIRRETENIIHGFVSLYHKSSLESLGRFLHIVMIFHLPSSPIDGVG
jgi:hypothetical protein